VFKCVRVFKISLEEEDSKEWSDLGYKSIVWPPPKMIPIQLEQGYTLGDLIPVHSFYITEKQNGGTGYHWEKGDIDYMAITIFFLIVHFRLFTLYILESNSFYLRPVQCQSM
jgi:hypothetical protein